MATRAEQRLLTADEFLQIDFGPNMKAELDNGVIRMMGGATRQHSRVQQNLARRLGNALEGSGCRPHGSDMAVRIGDRSIRYPDMSIDCGDRTGAPNDLVAADPRVVIEILSPSTRRSDLIIKREEYQAVEGIDTIVFVDPEAETIATLQREDYGWKETSFTATDLDLPSFQLTIPHAQIFARD